MARENNIVTVKFPTFIPEDPDLWMAQMEHGFLAYRINCPIRKYNYLLSNLDMKAAMEVKDLVINPPINANTNDLSSILYQEEKKNLLKRLRTSVTRRLLEREQMGKRTPSQFLYHLKKVAGPSADENIIKEQWIGKLPNQIMQEILRIRMTESFESLGKLADLLAYFAANAAATAAVAKQQPQQQAASLHPRMSENEENTEDEALLLQRVNAMKIQIAKFTRCMNDQLDEMRLVLIRSHLEQVFGVEIIKPE